MMKTPSMIHSRLTNLIMAIGLVMVFFFIDGLNISVDTTSFKLNGEGNHIVEARVISPVNTSESKLNSGGDEVQLSAPEVTQQVVEVDIQNPNEDSQAFIAPNQAERPHIISSQDNLEPISEIPLRLVIPTINLDAPIISMQPEAVKIGGKELLQWHSPDEYAAGWHETSAKLGEVGNTVLNGHHNYHGEVFKYLVDLVEGDLIKIYSNEYLFTYQITNKMILPEKYETLDVRMANAQWILPSQDERLTMITCWPYESNTHRLIIVAKPMSIEEIPDIDQELLPGIYDGNRLIKADH